MFEFKISLIPKEDKISKRPTVCAFRTHCATYLTQQYQREKTYSPQNSKQDIIYAEFGVIESVNFFNYQLVIIKLIMIYCRLGLSQSLNNHQYYCTDHQIWFSISVTDPFSQNILKISTNF
ncbi:Hypothetical_protein [Hexamita inflata]|uniref:Hypothetical_protein n=1 Tax=Hexamita inflata TaxID=28002 RepID=A0AA86TPT2_9EUKA|nr:Hypothetical protein HINF_LOCUS12689 [Hexamita inflata]CAI9968235.1 Hypothetical protein HINF_LOCUS55880 [Hexamita inflata]